MTLVEHRHDGTFEHEAFIYASDDEYVAGLVPYVLDGLADGDAVIAVVTEERATLLRAALGTAADDVDFVDARAWYRRPSITIAGYDGVLAGLGERRARVIGEVEFGDTAAEWAEWTRYEAALNRALVRRNARVVCPYDVRALPDHVIADARRTHPHLLAGEVRRPNGDYAAPEAVATDVRVELDVPDTTPDVDMRVEHDLAEMRGELRAIAAAAGFDERHAGDLILAVNEIVSNALVHGGGPASVRVWVTGHAVLTCVVDDSGPGIADPLAGFVPPDTGTFGGRGLWLVRQLVGRVELTTAPSGGLRVVLAATG
jgi:anti-sigma regulatory factor (Ser/Thr protein kinase)